MMGEMSVVVSPRADRRRGPVLLAVGLTAVLAVGALVRARGEAAAASAGPVRVISLDELRASMKGHQGRVLVLHLWATWCLPCMEELPLVGELAREAPARGVDLVSVSLDDPKEAAAVAKVLRDRGSAAMSRTILRVEDPERLVASINPKWEGAIPAFFAYDRSGKLRHAQVGEMTRTSFDELVRDLVPAVKK
jgi:thiol-disulfide isomerase/thioredoxin